MPRSSFGAPLGGKRHVMSGSSTMLGVAGVSYQAPIGDRVSGLFAFVDVGRAYPSPFPPWSLPPRGLFVFDATPSVAVAPIATLVRGIDHRTVAPIIPALESGRFRRGFGVSSMKILLAWSSRSGREVRIGFLRRDADGGWRFVETAAVATLPAVSNPTAPIQWNIDAAFDVTRGQWVVTWVVGNSSLDLVVIDFDGRPVGPVRKVLDFGEMIDSPGVMVAFNKFTGRYLIQLQHNLRRIRLTDRGTQCLAADGSDASCFAEEEMRDIGRAEITAIHVIYRPGWEFRSGGRCERPSVCRSRAGISEVFSLTGGYSFGGFVAKYWIPERDASGSVGELWPPGDDPIEAGRVHRYVRCPHIGATLVLHVHDNRLAGSSGDLRYSFLEGDREPVDE